VSVVDGRQFGGVPVWPAGQVVAAAEGWQFGGVPVWPGGHVVPIGRMTVPAGAQSMMVFGPTRAWVGANGASQRHPVARF
jgi:hypothetical protein